MKRDESLTLRGAWLKKANALQERVDDRPADAEPQLGLRKEYAEGDVDACDALEARASRIADIVAFSGTTRRKEPDADYGNVTAMPAITTSRFTPRVASGSVAARRTVRSCSR